MIGTALRLEQLVLAGLPFGVELPDALLFLVGKARRHRTSRYQQHRQVAEAKRADQQPRHDLVANSEQGGRIEHAVAERDGGAHRDHVPAEQRQVHAGLALRNPVAHRRDPARDLRRRADLAGEDLHLLGVAAVGLMGRQHVVVSGHDRDIGTTKRADRRLVLARGRKAVGEIAAGQARTADPPLLLLGHEVEIAAARRPRPLDDPVGDAGDGGMESHGAYLVLRSYSCQLIPSRSVSAMAADGPHVPAA